MMTANVARAVPTPAAGITPAVLAHGFKAEVLRLDLLRADRSTGVATASAEPIVKPLKRRTRWPKR